MAQTSTGAEREERVAEEKAEQARWKPRSSDPRMAWFERFIEHEFLPVEQQQAALRRRLRNMIGFAAAEIPYYRDLFARLKLAPEDIASPEQLVLLPELTKETITQQENRLIPSSLPAGEEYGGLHASSGSTGKPVRVFETRAVRHIRLLLAQRQLRWYRFDPTAVLGVIRAASNFPPVNGREPGPGETVTLDGWRGFDKLFHTGPYLGFVMDNPLKDMVAWVEQHRPPFLFSTTSVVEHLAFAFQDRDRPAGLKGIRVMSEPLRSGQEKLITETFGAPVHISYGLDEVGWVATRCTAGGRYHVHAEHCLVEIVDDEGKPCRPGQYGRLLLTVLSNRAMPLIRYDTDDIAQALEGPCPCGRTLPAFGEIVGRHSHRRGLPAGTMPVVAALRSAMENLPRELSMPVREYQIRRSPDGNFQLCIILAGPWAAGFDRHMQDVFADALAAAGPRSGGLPTLSIVEVTHIPLTPSKKFFHFVSAFTQPALAKDRAELPTRRWSDD